jgi:hypothetical protein
VEIDPNCWSDWFNCSNDGDDNVGIMGRISHLFSFDATRTAQKRRQADKHTRKETTEKNEGKQHRNKTQMENMQSVTTWKKGS